MKQTWIYIAVAMLLLVAGGCGKPHDHASAADPVKPPGAQKQAAHFEIIQEPYPQEVLPSLEKVRRSGGTEVVSDDGKSYVVIGAGERPTGGYSLSVAEVIRGEGGTWTIKVKEIRPKQGQMTTAVLTYPIVVVAIQGKVSDVRVTFI